MPNNRCRLPRLGTGNSSSINRSWSGTKSTNFCRAMFTFFSNVSLFRLTITMLLWCFTGSLCTNQWGLKGQPRSCLKLRVRSISSHDHMAVSWERVLVIRVHQYRHTKWAMSHSYCWARTNFFRLFWTESSCFSKPLTSETTQRRL